jgi:two-component system nitrate/nitrite response regulator NarL
VAAATDPVRQDLVARTTAAGFPVAALAADPQALIASLATLSDAWVVTGGRVESAQAFLRAALATAVPVLAIISGGERVSLRHFLTHGAAAVLDASCRESEFCAAAVAVQQGLAVWEPDEQVPAPMDHRTRVPLSARERDVLARVAAGLTTKAIARQLALSPNTVKFHLRAAFDKLEVTSRAEAVAIAIRRGELSV